MKPNLFYNKFFCGLGTIPLPKLHSIDSAVASYEGFSIRVHKYADGDANKQMMRFDLLPAYVCFNPHMGGQFLAMLDYLRNNMGALAPFFYLRLLMERKSVFVWSDNKAGFVQAVIVAADFPVFKKMGFVSSVDEVKEPKKNT